MGVAKRLWVMEVVGVVEVGITLIGIVPAIIDIRSEDRKWDSTMVMAKRELGGEIVW